MGESFVQEAGERGYSPDWSGDSGLTEQYLPIENVVEVVSDIDQQELKDELLNQLHSDGTIAKFHAQGDSSLGDFYCEAFDEFTFENKELPRYSLKICSQEYGEVEVSLRDLMRCLRDTGLPLKCSYSGYWLVWDSTTQSVRARTPGASYSFDTGLSRHSQLNEKIKKLLQRSWHSVDHGLKPILLHRDDENKARLENLIQLMTPSYIPLQQFKEFSLCYVNIKGGLEFQSLESFDLNPSPTTSSTDSQFFLATRAGTYISSNEGLRLVLDGPQLCVNAFYMALKYSPSQLNYFSQKNIFTPYQSVFSRVPVEINRNNTEPLSQLFKKIKDLLGVDCTYLTNGDHPMKVCVGPSREPKTIFTTTFDLYERFVFLLESLGSPSDWAIKRLKFTTGPSVRIVE